MKKTKKLLSLALSLVMAIAMVAPAMAAEITLKDAQKGETYDLYQIFDYTTAGADKYAYTIAKDSKWFSVVDNYKYDNKDIFTLTASKANENIYVVAVNDSFAGDSAAADFAKYLGSNIPTDAPKTTKTAGADGEVSFGDLATGYYFVDTSLGALCSLYNNDTAQEIKEKNAEPTLNKEIVGGVTVNTEENDAITVSIGDTVNYKITVTDGTGTDKAITVHDVMEAGLTLDENSFEVKVDDDVVDADNYAIAYKVNHKEDPEDAEKVTSTCTFEIVFNDNYVASLADGKQIVITYSATLNENAEISTDTNDNTAWLTYSKQESEKDTVSVYTYEFDLKKVDSEGNLLNTEGDLAKFKLYDAVTGGNEIAVVKVSEGVYRIAKDGETGVEIEAGSVVIKGLEGSISADVEAGNGKTYYLEETSAPQGYNILTARVSVTIKNANLKLGAVDNGSAIVVVNETGALLPSTGGMGTTLFYALGGVMVAGAAILLITKKRMNGAED